MAHNEDLSFFFAESSARRAFKAQTVRRRLFSTGHAFYKFTDYPLEGPGGRVTPWWLSVPALDGDDTGRSGAFEAARRLGVSPATFLGSRSAVSWDWNEMSDQLEVVLLQPAYGFFGKCASQAFDHRDDRLANVVFIGGGYQVYLPNLDKTMVARVSRKHALRRQY